MTSKNCILCGEEIFEENGKLKGTMLRIVEDKKAKLIYVCDSCMKIENWIEKAKVKSA